MNSENNFDAEKFDDKWGQNSDCSDPKQIRRLVERESDVTNVTGSRSELEHMLCPPASFDFEAVDFAIDDITCSDTSVPRCLTGTFSSKQCT